MPGSCITSDGQELVEKHPASPLSGTTLRCVQRTFSVRLQFGPSPGAHGGHRLVIPPVYWLSFSPHSLTVPPGLPNEHLPPRPLGLPLGELRLRQYTTDEPHTYLPKVAEIHPVMTFREILLFLYLSICTSYLHKRDQVDRQRH